MTIRPAHGRLVQAPQTSADAAGSGGGPSVSAAARTRPADGSLSHGGHAAGTRHMPRGGPSLAGAPLPRSPPCRLPWPGSWPFRAGCDAEGKTGHWQLLISVSGGGGGRPQRHPLSQHGRFPWASNPPLPSPEPPRAPRCHATDGLGADGQSHGRPTSRMKCTSPVHHPLSHPGERAAGPASPSPPVRLESLPSVASGCPHSATADASHATATRVARAQDLPAGALRPPGATPPAAPPQESACLPPSELATSLP